jgi:hypothetical protein
VRHNKIGSQTTLWVKICRLRIFAARLLYPLKPDIARRGWHGRKVPTTAVSGCNNGCTRRASYSITSSARASSDGGTAEHVPLFTPS